MTTTESIREREERKQDVFNALLGIRIAFYKLMDLNLWNDDCTVSVEQDLLHRTGFDMEDYDDFRNSEPTESWKEFKKTFFSN